MTLAPGNSRLNYSRRPVGIIAHFRIGLCVLAPASQTSHGLIAFGSVQKGRNPNAFGTLFHQAVVGRLVEDRPRELLLACLARHGRSARSSTFWSQVLGRSEMTVVKVEVDVDVFMSTAHTHTHTHTASRAIRPPAQASNSTQPAPDFGQRGLPSRRRDLQRGGCVCVCVCKTRVCVCWALKLPV